MTGVMKAAVYCRLSQDRTGTEKKVTEQEADCREIAASRGWHVDQVFVDNDLSAWKTGVRRPGFDGLLEAIDQRAVDVVIVWHPDRLLRQPRDLERLLDTTRDRGVQLASAGGGKDLSNPDDVFILRIETAHACRSSDDTSRRVQRGHLAAAKAGRPGGGGIRPYGYEADRMTIRESEASIVREATARVLDGEPLYAVAQDLQQRQVPTVRGGRWDPTTLRVMLARPRLAGLREHKGEIIGKAAWPAILPESQWRELRAVFDPRSTGPSRRDFRYWLTGIVRCDRCKRPMSSVGGRGVGDFRYGCSKDRGGCGKTYRRAEPLEHLVGDLIVAWLEKPGRAEQLAAERDGQQPALAADRDQIIADEQMLTELAKRWATNRMTLGEYDAAREIIDARLRETRRRLPSSLPRGLQAMAGPAARQRWNAATPTQKRTIARALFEAIVLLPVTGGRRNVFNPAFVDPVWRRQVLSPADSVPPTRVGGAVGSVPPLC